MKRLVIQAASKEHTTSEVSVLVAIHNVTYLALYIYTTLIIETR